MHVRKFALLLSSIFIVLGILGFVPGITVHHMQDDFHLIVTGPGTGKLVGLFHVNVLHNIVHILFGVLGIVMARTGKAMLYCRLVAIIYLVLGILGMIPAANTWHTWGIVPIEGNDVWLHILIAFVAAWFGYFVDQKLLGAETPNAGLPPTNVSR